MGRALIAEPTVLEARRVPGSKPELWRVEPIGDSGDADLAVYPHAGQKAARESRARFTWILAGTQGGKTSFGPLWLMDRILEHGPGDYLAVTSNFSLLKLKMLPEFLRLFLHTLHWGRWSPSDKVFYIDGKAAGIGAEARVIFGSAVKPESLESATAKAAWLDECGQDDWKLESWEAVQRRLSIFEGPVLGGTTIYNLGWLLSQVYNPWRDGDTTHNVIQFPSILNPVFPRGEYERAKRTLPEWRFLMQYGGQFSRPGGLIYDDYIDESRLLGGHLVEDFAIPAAWPRYVGLDFGGANTATVWLAYDPSGDVYYAYRESLEGGYSTPQHVQRFRWRAGHGPNIAEKPETESLAPIGPPENVSWIMGGAASETQQRADWAAAGLPVWQPEMGDVEVGIAAVTELFRTRRLFVLRSLKGLRDELGTYKRKLDTLGLATNEIEKKRLFHRLDGLRYIAVGIKYPPTFGILATRSARGGFGAGSRLARRR